MACAGCGSELSPGFAFCPRCGLAQRMDSREADRREVTVLFADVSAFTALAERLDPEEVRAFQNALFETLGQAVARYQGFVEKFVGDAVMAVFGAPVAHEDDPERALFAALDMIERSARLDEAWKSRLGRTIELHIGIHTGPVVAGRLGTAAAAAYAVTGDTVNTTARLLAEASGTVLVSEATYELTRHRFAFAPGRELALRGRSKPVRAHRLIGALAEARSARGLAAHGLSAPMLGRTAELERLLAAFEHMQEGHAQVVCVIGEAGAGKTRLIAEFLDRLERDGRLASSAVRRVACSSLGEPTYGIFGALFREAYRVGPDDSLEVARQKLVAGLGKLGAPAEAAETVAPVLSYVLGVQSDQLRDLEPEQLKRQIMLAARTLIERRLQQGLLLIVVEDLHWADAASVHLLSQVAGQLADQRLMVLLSQRSEAEVALMPEAAHLVVQLASLPPETTQALVAKLFGPVDGHDFPRLQQLIVARSGGNPLFVEEIVRSLVSEGVLAHEGDRWVCTASCEGGNVPGTLHGLLLSRIDRIAAGARRVLQEAAVLGETFDEAILRAIAAEPGGVAAELASLVRSDLIVRDNRDGARYRFTHALVHEAAYQNLLLTRRTELHERVGRVLERAVGARPERLSDLEALGHHWSLSPDKSKGAQYLVAAGDWARALYANEDAIRHYERALRTLAQCQACEEQVQLVRERIADLLALAGRRADALAHYDAVCRHYELAADSVGAARLHRKIGGLHWEAGDRDRAHACFSSGLQRLGDNGHLVERAQLFQEMGRLAFRAGDNSGAVAWAERALAEAGNEDCAVTGPERAREIAGTQAQAYNTLGVALARTGRAGEAVGHIERSIALAQAHDLLQAACRGYANLGVLYSFIDPRRSIDTCLRGLKTAKKAGDLGFQSRLYANLAVAYCSLTDRCEAEGIEAAQISADLDRRLGLADHLAIPLIVLGQIHQCRGERTLAFASYEEALALAEQAGEPQLLFPCYDGLATLHLDDGNDALAETYLAKSLHVCERAGLDPDDLTILPFLC